MHVLSKDIYSPLCYDCVCRTKKDIYFYLNEASVASYHKDNSRLPKLLSYYDF